MPAGLAQHRRDAPPGVAELYRGDELDAMLPTADFVILTVPHTPETEGFMNRTRFQEMKKTAFFINIGRGMTTRLDDRLDRIERRLDLVDGIGAPAVTTPRALVQNHRVLSTRLRKGWPARKRRQLSRMIS